MTVISKAKSRLSIVIPILHRESNDMAISEFCPSLELLPLQLPCA